MPHANIRSVLCIAVLLAAACNTPRVQPVPTSIRIVDSSQVVSSSVADLAREPMIVEHPNGTLFVSGYMDPRPKMWKSADKGCTWERVNLGTEEDGARA